MLIYGIDDTAPSKVRVSETPRLAKAIAKASTAFGIEVSDSCPTLGMFRVLLEGRLYEVRIKPV